MINNVTPRQIPLTQGPVTNAVNIQIFNPQANAASDKIACQAPTQVPMPMGYPAPMPVNYQVPMQTNYQPITQSLYQTNTNNQVANYPQNYNNDLMKNSKQDIAPVSTDDKKQVENEQKQAVPLTDEYIMSLENYLNNSNPKIRLMASKEILDRFGEDKTRANDPALTALLNKVLQDPTETVRFIGLTTLDLGYAKGDDLTVQILKQIQQNTQDNYGEDALLASQILLKMSSGQ